jgi:hypothetical protein
MANSFTLDFNYQINYKRSDVLYFGINFFLGCRDFPIRVRTSGGSGGDLSPNSSRTLTFQSPSSLPISVTNSNLISTEGLDDIQLEMLYSDPSQFDEYTFRMGSVGITQTIEFSNSSGGGLDSFFSANQFTLISDAKATVTIGDTTTTLVSKPNEIKLGKQYGEILLLSWQAAT